MKLTTRLTLVFILFAALLLSIVGYLAYNNGRYALRSATIADLQGTALEKQFALNNWVDDKRLGITLLAADPVVIESAAELTAAPPGSPEAQAAHDKLVAEVRPRVTGGEFQALLLINAQTGEVIASTDPGEEGKFKEDRLYFLNGKKMPYVESPYYSVDLQSIAMTASAPLISLDGRILGVMAGRLNLDEMNAIISRRTGLHQTDDAYLVNTASLFVTQPRFITDPAVLQHGVHSQSVNDCLQRKSGVNEAPDYRQVPAIVVYHWFPEQEMCLIVKIDQAEAYAPAKTFGGIVSAFSALAFLFAAVLAYWLARTITVPVQELIKGVRQVGTGDLDAHIDINNADEIGELAKAFVHMKEDLQQSLVSRADLIKENTERKQVEETLRESEHRLHSLFDNMLNGFAYCKMIFDHKRPQDFVYLEVNRAFGTLTGLKNVTGRRVSEIIPGIREADPELFETYGRVSLTGIPETFENYVEPLKMWFSITVYSPEKEYFVAVFEVITERKRAEVELQKAHDELEIQVQQRTAALSQANMLLQTLLDNMPDQIYFKDSQSRFIKNSRAQANALGVSDPSQIVGKSDFDFFPHAQRSYDEEQEIIRSGSSLVDAEEWVVWPDGHGTWVSTSKVPLRDPEDKIIGTFGISRDITDRKQKEEALRRANEELEAFSYSVSHDLRAPLRGIDGWSQALLEDYGDKFDGQGQEYIKRVRSETQHMGELIDALLQLSRITRAEMHTEPVDLSAAARSIAVRLQESEPQRQVEFIIQKGLSAKGDAHLLDIALTNLLGNAFKFTGKLPKAQIEFGQKIIDDQRVFFVRDNGAGFDMAFAKKLFGAFQRMHKASDFPGTGIGLTTVQRIIHRHGGQVWVESVVNEGATFFFTIEES